MKTGKNYTLLHRRKREKKTDYKARLGLLSSRKLRLVVRRSLNNILLQIVTFEPKGDKTLVSAHSRELLKYGWNAHRGNVPTAYLLGFMCGLKAKKKGIQDMVLDLGLLKAIPGSSPFAALKGVLDVGIRVPYSEKVLPREEALQGSIISLYAQKTLPQNQFSKTLKKTTIQDLTQHFAEVKQKIQLAWQ